MIKDEFYFHVAAYIGLIVAIIFLGLSVKQTENDLMRTNLNLDAVHSRLVILEKRVNFTLVMTNEHYPEMILYMRGTIKETGWQ